MRPTHKTHQNHQERLPVSTTLLSIDGHLQMISAHECLIIIKLKTDTVDSLFSALIDNLVGEANVDTSNML